MGTKETLEALEELTPEQRKALFMIIKLAHKNPLLLQSNEPQNEILNIFRGLFKRLCYDVTGNI